MRSDQLSPEPRYRALARQIDNAPGRHLIHLNAKAGAGVELDSNRDFPVVLMCTTRSRIPARASTNQGPEKQRFGRRGGSRLRVRGRVGRRGLTPNLSCRYFFKLTNTDPFAAKFVVTRDDTPDGIRVVRSVLGAISSLPIVAFREKLCLEGRGSTARPWSCPAERSRPFSANFTLLSPG